jgi:hypothetical protein
LGDEFGDSVGTRSHYRRNNFRVIFPLSFAKEMGRADRMTMFFMRPQKPCVLVARVDFQGFKV